MDPVQIVIIGISVVLTSLFIALGIQLWFILREVRYALQKLNTMLQDFGKVSSFVGEGANNMSGLLAGLKAGLSLVSNLRKKGEDGE